MKTVLAIWHSADKGKTETLREFANLLLLTFRKEIEAIEPIPAIVAETGDFRLIFKLNGKIIGILSQGDPNTNLEEKLIELAVIFHCEIIVCSSRTKGDTVNAVNNLWKTKGFQIIWTSTYQIADKSLHQQVNRIKAKHILSLLIDLNLI